MADVRSLLRNEQASRRIIHPNLSYTKSGLLNCLVCHLIIKSETLWEGHLRSPNHKKNLLKAQNGGLEDVNGTVSKKRKISDERDDVRKRKRSTGVEQEDMQKDGVQGPEEEQKPPTNNGLNDAAGPAIPDDDESSATPALLAKASAPTQPPQPKPQPQIDEDEWAAFEREVAPLSHQTLPAQSTDYSSATISAAPVSAAELAAQTNAERQQRRDAEVEDEKAEEETRLVEEFEVMEGLEERVKRLKEKREALRMGAGPIGDGTGEEDAEGKQKPPDRDDDDDDDDDEDDSDEVDEWGFA